MYFSGKISHSILLYLESQEIDLEGLFELTELNFEFLRDPTSWLEAHLLEDFLYQVQKTYENTRPMFIQKSGEHCPQLKAWGVLDGVLKMMTQPSDFYAQPERFISYFISPAPQIHSLELTPGTVSFDTPISSIEFPIVAEFLKSAFGSLPAYMGRPHATVKWEETQIQIMYGRVEEAPLAKEEVRSKNVPEVTPELIESVFHNLEVKQFEIDSKNKSLNLKEQELQRLKKDLKFLVNKTKNNNQVRQEAAIPRNFQGPLDELLLNVQKFNDYFSRAQQLITLLVGSKRLDPQVRAAMKRVKWEQVAELSPILAQKIYSQIDDLEAGASVPQEPSEALGVSAHKISSSDNLSEKKLLTGISELTKKIPSSTSEIKLNNRTDSSYQQKPNPTNSFLINDRPI